MIQESDKLETQKNDLEADVFSSVQFIRDNIQPILLFGALGLIIGIYLNVTKNQYTPGLAFNTYEVSVNILDDSKFDLTLPRNDSYRINEGLYLGMRSELPEALDSMISGLHWNKSGHVDQIIFERIPPAKIRISFRDSINLDLLEKEIEDVFVQLVDENNQTLELQNNKTFTKVVAAKKEIGAVEFRSNAFVLKFKPLILPHNLSEYSSLLRRIEQEKIENKPWLALQTFVDILYLTSLDESDRAKAYLEYSTLLSVRDQLDRELVELSKQSINMEKATIDVKDIKVASREVTSKVMIRRFVILISLLFAGLFLGAFITPFFKKVRYTFEVLRKAVISVSHK